MGSMGGGGEREETVAYRKWGEKQNKTKWIVTRIVKDPRASWAQFFFLLFLFLPIMSVSFYFVTIFFRAIEQTKIRELWSLFGYRLNLEPLINTAFRSGSHISQCARVMSQQSPPTVFSAEYVSGCNP